MRLLFVQPTRHWRYLMIVVRSTQLELALRFGLGIRIPVGIFCGPAGGFYVVLPDIFDQDLEASIFNMKRINLLYAFPWFCSPLFAKMPIKQ
jgi:hypothetical protein